MGSVVQVHPDPPTNCSPGISGAIAQLGERLLCKQEVTGSIPVGSTRQLVFGRDLLRNGTATFHFAVRFIRLLFKNSEEVKRTRFFSEPGSSGYEIALEVMSAGTLSVSVARQARPEGLLHGAELCSGL